MDVLSWSRHHRLFPGRGHLRPRRLRRPRPARRVHRPAVARGLQRRLPADRRACGPHARPAGRSPGWRTWWQAGRRGLPTRRTTPRGRRARGLRLRRGPRRGHRRGRRAARPARLHLPRPAPQQGRPAVDRGTGPDGLQRAARPRPGADPGRGRLRGRRPGRVGRARAARSRRRPSTAVRSPTSRSCPAFRAPDGTEVFLGPVADGGTRPGCRSSRAATSPTPPLLTGIDHVNLAEPWQCFDEAVLFYSSVLGLSPSAQPGGRGAATDSSAARSSASASGSCRLALNVAPLAWDAPGDGFPQHVAFSTDDVVAVARRAVDARASSAADPAELLRRPDRPLRPRRRRGRDDGRARPAPRPRRHRRLHALLHRHRRRRVLRGRPAPRRLRRYGAPTPAYGWRRSTGGLGGPRSTSEAGGPPSRGSHGFGGGIGKMLAVARLR